MPLWNALIGVAGSGIYLFASVRTTLFRPDKLNPVSGAVPDLYYKILRSQAKKIGVKNPERIELYFVKGLASSCSGTTLTQTGGFLGLAEHYGAKSGEMMSRYGSVANFSIEDRNALRKMWEPTENKLLFTIGHELVHFKYNDLLKDGMRQSAWMFTTAYPLTDLLLKVLPDDLLEMAGGTFPFIDSFLGKGALVATMWLASFYLLFKVEKHFSHQQEYRADRIAAQTSLKAALGGIESLTQMKELGKITRQHRAKAREKIDEEGESVDKNDDHPKFSERIRRLEAIVAEHKAKQSEKGL